MTDGAVLLLSAVRGQKKHVFQIKFPAVRVQLVSTKLTSHFDSCKFLNFRSRN